MSISVINSKSCIRYLNFKNNVCDKIHLEMMKKLKDQKLI